MPLIPELVYAALFYEDDASPENPESKEFVQGTETENGKLIFSFQRPDDTDGITFTLEICAFVKTEGEETPQFSRATALLSGKEAGLEIVGDKIIVEKAIPLSSSEPGTVSLKIKVPAECSLEIDNTANFNCEKDESSSNTYTLTQKDENGISADAYQVTFTVRKDSENREIVHIFSECINVINGLCTDTWSGLEKGVAKNVTNSISKAVYVRGADGWYDGSEYNETATASDENSGSLLSPLATIQKAVDTIIARNDETSKYTIYIDGTLKWDETTYIGTSGMADFTALKQELNLTIKALSGTATLDGGAVFGADGTVETAGIGKRIIYANHGTNGKLNLTLEKLVVTRGSNGGVYVSRNNELTMNDCEISKFTSSRGGAVYVDTDGTFTMEDGTISDCKATTQGGGIYNSGTASISGCTIELCKATVNEDNGGGGGIYSSGTLTVTGGSIYKCMAEQTKGGGLFLEGSSSNQSQCIITGVTISECKAKYGGGVNFYTYATLTMENGTIISKNTASQDGGGVYLYFYSNTFTMNGGAISGNTASQNGGGVYVYSNGGENTFTMESGTIGGTSSAEANTAKDGGGAYVNGTCTFTMEDGKITGNTASSSGGGVYAKSGTFNLNGGTISDCTAIQQGGGVSVDTSATFNMSGTAKITGCKVTSTSSNTGGGGIYNAGTLAITSGTISSCTSKKNGGGIYVREGTFTMENGIVSGNSVVTYYGGGVYVESGGMFTMNGGTIGGDTDDKKNTAQCGGGVYITNGTFNLEGGTISGNTATYSGGGVEAGTAATFTMNGGAISGNTAVNSNGGYGGGIYAGTNNFIMNGGTISGCKATTGGGLFIAPSRTSTMNGGTISGNSATEKARGVFLDSSSTLNMSSNAKIESDNDVYLNSQFSKICITGALTASPPVATITHSFYSAVTSVLSAGTDVTIDSTVCNKFAVSPHPENGGEWKIIPSSGTGKLIKVSP